jgi:hypothetical protein
VLVVAILVVGLAAAGADAKKHKKKKKSTSWNSTVTLSHPSSTLFTGRVDSKLDNCRDARLATLYYTDPAGGGPLPLAVERTDGNGIYQMGLVAPAYPGTYQVQVTEEQIRAKKKKQTCKGAQSAVVPV